MKELIEKLSKETKASYVEIDNTNYIFNLTDEVRAEIKKIEDSLYITSKILPSPESKKEEIFTFVMELNLLRNVTGNTTIGLSDNEKFLTLSSVMTYEENYKIFKENIENFINYLLYIEDEIRKFQKSSFEKIY